MMVEEKNRVTVLRFYQELINLSKLELAHELFADDFNLEQNAGTDALSGPEEVKRIISNIKSGFPDFYVDVRQLDAFQDKVTAYIRVTGCNVGVFNGMSPTRKLLVMSGVATFHLVDGKITESWIRKDDGERKEEHGLIPAIEVLN